MVEAQGWHLVDAELAASEQPAMSGDHVELGVNQHGHIKAEGADAFGNLPDLSSAVLARVCRVRFKFGSRTRDDIQTALTGGDSGQFDPIV